MLAFFGVAMLALFVLAGACGSGRGWFIDRRHIDSVIRTLRRTRFADEGSSPSVRIISAVTGRAPDGGPGLDSGRPQRRNNNLWFLHLGSSGFQFVGELSQSLFRFVAGE